MSLRITLSPARRSSGDVRPQEGTVLHAGGHTFERDPGTLERVRHRSASHVARREPIRISRGKDAEIHESNEIGTLDPGPLGSVRACVPGHVGSLLGAISMGMQALGPGSTRAVTMIGLIGSGDLGDIIARAYRAVTVQALAGKMVRSRGKVGSRGTRLQRGNAKGEDKPPWTSPRPDTRRLWTEPISRIRSLAKVRSTSFTCSRGSPTSRTSGRNLDTSASC